MRDTEMGKKPFNPPLPNPPPRKHVTRNRSSHCGVACPKKHPFICFAVSEGMSITGVIVPLDAVRRMGLDHWEEGGSNEISAKLGSEEVGFARYSSTEGADTC
ncbi:hypothetical protein AVEN_105788-1 [Araneus ventricosus]|uniref:Uncharacterized protein n=1 Tax=Araneus ventricosus TaxID=182803 RepID=A0A4Y2PXD7_ARAVE|nr:hypothetical protein AVEN_239400-1 [Araneus ventricosus]GBN55854.1 hypothetical protein AVEN_105788-1 [Araneus ventricosus]